MRNFSFLRRLLPALLTFGTLAAQAQNVGINTPIPTQTLDVNGSLRIRGLNGTGTRLPVVQPDGTLGMNAPVYITPTTAVAARSATVSTNMASTPITPLGVAVSGTTAYVIGYNSNNSSNPTLQVYDASNPASPVLKGSVGTGSNPVGVAVSGTTVYIVTGGSTLQVYDASNPASPVLKGSVSVSSVPGTSPVGVAVSGTLAYVVINGSNIFQVIDVSNPANPVLKGSAGTVGQPFAVAVSGTTAYVTGYGATSTYALQVFDASNPASPVLKGSASTDNLPLGVTVSGTTAYVVNYSSNTLQTFNVSNPASPLLLGSASTGSSPYSVALSGTLAYVANYNSNTLQVVDVSNPASPLLLGSVGTGTNPRSVAVSGTTAYVANFNSNTLLVTTVPLQPRAVTVNSDGSLGSVAFPSNAVAGPTGATGPQGATGATGPQGPAGLNGTNSLVAGSGLSATTTGNTTTVQLGGMALAATTDVPLAGNNLTFSGSGNVGIGTASPGQRLEVAGTIFSNSGGFRFPDGSTQATAASPAGYIQNTTTQQASSNFNISGSGTVGGNLRRAVRLCPANGSAYTLVAADVAFDNFKVATGKVPTTLTLPVSGAGQLAGQELTIYNTASTGFTISATNTDNTTTMTVAAVGTNGIHAVKYIWDGIWIRVQ